MKSVALRSVKEAFDANGISMPEPAYRLIGALPPVTTSPAATSGKAPREEPTGPMNIPPSDVEAGDVEVDRYLEDQIRDDRLESDASDLLQSDAPRE